MTKRKNNTFIIRKIFKEDHAALRKIVYIEGSIYENEGITYTYKDTLKKLHKFSEEQIFENGITYYHHSRFKRYTGSLKKNKSLGIPVEFYDFLNENCSKELPAKHLLSAIIQDYIIINNYL